MICALVTGVRTCALPIFLVVLGLAGGARAGDAKPQHRLVIQVDDNDPAKMNLALNNLTNIYEYYQQKGETVQVELVAYGPGLNIFRTDTRSEEHTSELQSLMRISYAVFCLKKKT